MRDTKCWKQGCENKITHRFSLKFSCPKASNKMDGKFCKEHYYEAINKDVGEYVLFVTAPTKRD